MVGGGGGGWWGGTTFVEDLVGGVMFCVYPPSSTDASLLYVFKI